MNEAKTSGGTINDYVNRAMRTKSPHWNGGAITITDFVGLLKRGDALGEHARLIKKALIGDPNKVCLHNHSPSEHVEWRGMIPETNHVPDLAHAVLGIMNETGEICTAFLRALGEGKQVDEANLDEEFGDLIWFWALYCRSRNIDPQTILDKNIAKLLARFPEKFTGELNETRDLAAETKAMASATTGPLDDIIVLLKRGSKENYIIANSAAFAKDCKSLLDSMQ